jgi:Flp pilus assembly pilin Flp
MRVLSGGIFIGLRRFFADEAAQDLAEFALIVAVVSLGAITAMNNLAANLTVAYTNIDSTFSYWVL